MKELLKNEFYLVNSYFTDFNYQLYVKAVLNGTSPGRCFVDNLKNPNSLALQTSEFTVLTGNPSNHDFNEFLLDTLLIPNLDMNPIYMPVVFTNNEWRKLLLSINGASKVDCQNRLYYSCTNKYNINLLEDSDKKEYLLLSNEILNEDNYEMPPHMKKWIKSGYPNHDFLDNGVGAISIYENQIVSWVISDCSFEREIEFGIRTKVNFRRKGFGKKTLSLATKHALDSKYNKIGWHCDDDNIASIKTAESVGYKLKKRYTYNWILKK